MNPTCDELTGRVRDICRGHDDNGQPVLTPEKCAAYRRLWGVDNSPGLLERGASLGVAIMRHIQTGGRKVDRDTFARRMATCGNCPFFIPDKATCEKCGCPLSRKALWAESECPDGRWDSEV